MKKLILIALALNTALFSQTISYSFSKPFETVKKHRDKGFYKFDNDYTEVYLEKDEKEMLFQIFDQNFQGLKKTEIAPIPEFEQHPTDEGFFSVKNDFFWFFSTWDRKSETERLFARPFDKDFLKFDAKPIKLIETSRLYLGTGAKYRYNYSTDSTKMLITYILKPTEKRDKLSRNIVGFNLFDDHMKKLYAGEIEMPYSEYDMDILDYEVDSRSNIYLLAKVKLSNSIDGEDTKENKKLFRYELIRVNQKDNSLQRIKIGLDNKYIRSSPILSEDLNHDIVICGYYSDQKRGSGSNGAYVIRLEYDVNNSVKDVKTTYCEFPAEVLKAYESERSRKKMEKKEEEGELEASNLTLDKIVFYPDGSMLILGEEYYVVEHTHSNGRTTYTTYTYYYNEILALKVDKTGKTVWCNKIPKFQSGSSTSDLSYFHHQYNGEDLFFYLDNEKNIDLALTEVPAAHKSGMGGYLTCVKIDKNGKISKRSVFNTRDEKVRIYPRNFEAISKNLIVDRLKEDKDESKVFKLEIK